MSGDRRNYATRFRGRVDRGGDAPAFLHFSRLNAKKRPSDNEEGRQKQEPITFTSNHRAHHRSGHGIRTGFEFTLYNRASSFEESVALGAAPTV